MLGRMFGREFHALVIFQKFLIADDFALFGFGPLPYSQNHRTEQQVDDKTLACIASGGDPDLFYDAREYNGKDSSTLDVFFNMLELLVRDDGDTAAEERRHNEGEFYVQVHLCSRSHESN